VTSIGRQRMRMLQVREGGSKQEVLLENSHIIMMMA
jgi:hypothetical protein